MNGITIYEFEALVPETLGLVRTEALHPVPAEVFRWLEHQCLHMAEQGEAAWVRLAQRQGRRAVQVTSFVGVIRTPSGFQVEVLPKVGKVFSGGHAEARHLLIEMLCCLQRFRHIQTDSAKISATRTPLLEVFIAEFLRAVELVVKRGLRSDYAVRQDNLFALRGKLQVASHLRHNMFRADRFFTEHDEFSIDRPENRLLHTALRRVLMLSTSHANQQLSRELLVVFADIPVSLSPGADFEKTRLGRGMSHYADALAWTRIILEEQAPLTGSGTHKAPSLLFRMEALFEAFVAKHLAKQVLRPFSLKTQTRGHHLISHMAQNWFRLVPDLLIQDQERDTVVLDTKWKLLDGAKANGTDKYGLSQGDFYQLQAYGHSYLSGQGDVVLIYPRTTSFNQPLPVFEFPKSEMLKLWVLPFCLKSKTLAIPKELSRWLTGKEQA